MRRNSPVKKGFTLAELLISLLILAEIATFSIPKILSTQQNGQNNAKAEEVAAMIAAAYQQAQLAGIVTANTQPSDLTPYMNYVGVDTSAALDDHLNRNANYVCGTNVTCLKMHTGDILFYFSHSFAGANSNNAITFFYDPDGQRTGIVGDTPGKAVCFLIYYNGRITSRANVITGTVNSWGGPFDPGAFDPSWFSWN